ncbi:hypothetical protein [Glycomyces buryatensis]|uniref:Uncharacterized protein n=1 Tax=Glycomyces buryatensis TaxID=2570927 RepID=A0A4S8QFG2_9ACTN|nr:hypothetical protein [Glycomyces buryatensis]THV43363.1 hypothetical protein FAB82_01405 [Glycomyces buryatensis]
MKVSKPVALIVMSVVLIGAIALIVGLIRLIGSGGYARYEGQCVSSNVSVTDRDYDEKFIECTDSEAHWEITKVYTSEPFADAWETKSTAQRWLDKKCDVNDSGDGPEREAFVFRVNDDRGFLACAVAIE